MDSLVVDPSTVSDEKWRNFKTLAERENADFKLRKKAEKAEIILRSYLKEYIDEAMQ